MGVFDVVGDVFDDAGEALSDVGGALKDVGGATVDFAWEVGKDGLKIATSIVTGDWPLPDGWLENVLEFCGVDWPEQDEAKMRELARAYMAFAEVVEQVMDGASPKINALCATNSGLGVDKFRTFWAQYDDYGSGWLPNLAVDLKTQARALDQTADAVEDGKEKLRAAAKAAAATILISIGLFAIPGVGLASAAAVTAARGVVIGAASAVGITLNATLATILAGAAVGAVTAVAVDLAVAQPISMAFGAQDGYDLSADRLLTTAKYGAVGGGFGAAVPAAATKLASVPKLANVPGVQKLPTALQSVPGRMAVGGGGAVFTDVVTGNDVSLGNTVLGAVGALPGGGAKAKTPKTPKTPEIAAANKPARTPDTPCYGGDPVDVATGELVQDATDVNLPGRLPLLLQRRHVSSFRHGGLFGPSWASPWDQHLELARDAVVFTTAEGMVLRYPVPEPGETVFPIAGPRWPLIWDGRAAGTFAIGDPRAGVAWEFALPEGTPPGRGGRIPLDSIADRAGNRIAFSYGSAGELLEVQHSGGYRIAVDTHEGRITRLRLCDVSPQTHLPEAGSFTELVSYGHDSVGNLARVVNSSGEAMEFTYDHAHKMTSWTDRNGLTYRFVYDAAGRCVHGEGTGGFLNADFRYGDGVTEVTDSTGQLTAYHFNEAHQITRIVDPLGHVVTKEWDPYNRLLAQTDPLGRRTTFVYDGLGNITEAVQPDGAVTRITWDGRCLPQAVTGPDGSVWRYEYDELGNRTAVIDPAGVRTEFSFDDEGRPTAVTDALGHSSVMTCNAAGLPMASAGPDRAVTEVERDGFGRPVKVTDPLGGQVRSGWTVEGLPAWRVALDGSREQWRWDGEDNLVEHTGATGGATSFEYTGFDRPSARTGPDGVRYEFAYDTELRLTGVTNPHELTWVYDYDPAGRLVGETDFNGRGLSYVLDAAGQLTTRTNGAGEVVEYLRDSAGRMVRQVHAATGRETVYEYDVAGRLTRTANPDADLAFAYDPVGRLLSETCNDRPVSYTYDVLGRRTSRTTPSGAVSTWEFDASGRPVSLDTGAGSLAFGYDKAGREVQRRIGSGAVLTQEWDASYRLTGQTLSTVAPGIEDGLLRDFHLAMNTSPAQERAYVYEPGGRLAAIDDSVTGRRSFAHDRSGRITAVDGRDWTERYAYDALGNITGAQTPGEDSGDRTFSGTLVRRAGRDRYEHDAQGRVVRRSRKLLSGGTKEWLFRWDADDRLTEAVVPDGSVWRYVYDPLARRVAKQRLAPDSSVLEEVRFTWDGTRLAEQTAPDGTSSTWEYAPGGHHPLTQASSAVDASQAEIDTRFYAIVTDLVGAPAELVNGDGLVAWRRRATLWGDGIGEEDRATILLRFPGQYYDAETGLDYNLFRYYDAGVGGYLTADPLGLPASPNNYGYTKDPARYSDPLGLAPNYPSTSEISLYRSPAAGRRASEANGLNPDNHTGHDLNAYLGGQPDAAAQYAGQSHDPGFHEFVMRSEFLEAFPRAEFEFPLEAKTGSNLGLTEWRIPIDRIPEFNSYIDPSKTRWYEAMDGWYFLME